MILLTYAWLTFSLSTTLAQEYPRKEIDLDRFVQELFSQQDDDVNYEDLYESLFQLYSTPLNLNTATRDELAATYLLSENQLNRFFAYRATTGKLLSVYELQAIPGFDLPTIYRLLPFIEVQDNGLQADTRSLWKRITDEPNNSLLLRYSRTVEQKKGFSAPDTSSSGNISQRYLGQPGSLYARYRINHSKDFSFGFTVEKDAGEQLIWQPATRRYGTDFLSFHAVLENRGRWKSIAIGDYQLQAGQGLLLSAGFAVGKGSETITTIRRNHLGIRPYTSVLESGFFRGAAATYNLGRVDVTGFYSNARRDAIIGSTDSLSAEDDYFESAQITGFHRTLNEVAGKGNVREQTVGTTALYQSRNNQLQVGGTIIHTSYSADLIRKPTSYNQFEFTAKRNDNAGLHYSYLWQNINFFGEIARSKSGGMGLVSGFISSLTPRIELAMLYRRYDKDFHSFYGNAFGENTRNVNEHGLYWGIKITPIRKVIFSAYYDQFRFPWLKYRVDAPSGGYEYLARLAYRPTKTVLLYAQYREETKEINQQDNTTPMDFLAPATKRSYIFNIDYPATKYILLKSRVQGSSYQQSNAPTFGYAVIQDITVELGKLKVSTRVALFDTDDYDNRQYVYEKDVLYAFSIPAYYQRGIRNYALLQYQVNRKTDLWLRYAKTSLRNQDTIGSGLEEINAPHKTEVKMQVRYKF